MTREFAKRCHRIRKLSFFFIYNSLWNKELSKTTTLPSFAFVRGRSQDVLLMSWCSMTIWRAHIERCLPRIWNNFLARLLRREPRSPSGSVNSDRRSFNDEQRLRHASDCCYGLKHPGGGKINQDRTKFRKALALQQQRPCAYCTIIFVSENDVQDGSPTRWQTNN